MSKAKEILEALQFRTLIRGIKEKIGSRNIRNLVENASIYAEKMIKPDNGSPSPKDENSMENLRMAVDRLEESVQFLRKVKDKKK